MKHFVWYAGCLKTITNRYPFNGGNKNLNSSNLGLHNTCLKPTYLKKVNFFFFTQKAWSQDYRGISFLRAIFTYDLFDDHDDEEMEGDGNTKYVMDILLNIQSPFTSWRSDIPYITTIVIHLHFSSKVSTFSPSVVPILCVAVTLWFHTLRTYIIVIIHVFTWSHISV